MKKLILEIISMIESQIQHPGQTYLLKVEDFDTPIVYMEICKHFSAKKDLHFIANLEYNKYSDFAAQENAEWNYALDYLNSNGFAKNEPLTKYRNLAADKSDKKALLLLMGSESALDKGSLRDFNHISMSDIVERLKKDYSLWFQDILLDVTSDTEHAKQVVNNLYKDLFRHINVDAMQLSRFVDELENCEIDTFNDLVEHIYATLQEYWDIPSIRSNLKKPGKKALKYISNSYLFIHNSLNISSSKLKKLPEKLEKYAADEGIAINAPFESFDSYEEFGKCLKAFLENKNINDNRSRFLQCDFGVITKILDLQWSETEQKPPKDRVIKLNGEPLTVYLEMLCYSWLQFREKYDFDPLNTDIHVTKIRLSNCTASDSNDNDNTAVQAHFENICTYMGGLLDYIKDKGLKNNSIAVDYADGIDPFLSQNIDAISSRLDTIEKWGADSEIHFTLISVGNSENEKKKTEFKWTFSPYANWKNAFSLLRHLRLNGQNGSSPESPLLTRCSKMEELLASECEDEFFIKLESIQCDIVPDYSNVITQNFKDCFLKEFSLLHISFSNWIDEILEKGFFSCLSSMSDFISNYINLLDKITENYTSYPENVKSKIGYILNIFNIISNNDFLSTVKSSEVIVPAYHPAMLEKIIARNDFIIFSFCELLDRIDTLEDNKIETEFDSFSKLAAITQGVDIVPCGSHDKLICKAVWGFYALYYGENKKKIISGIELIPEESDNNAEISEHSNIIKHHILNYVKTFPSRVDGLNVAFVSPTEIQYVVEGINKVTSELDRQKINAAINLKVICFGGSKNIGGYLKYWLNNYMTKERTVTIKTYLQYISPERFDAELTELLQNQDVCFVYDILKTESVSLERYITNEQEEFDYQVNCQFPMTFIPDTISATHDFKRKINISQMQFLVSKAYTQLANRTLNPDSVDGQYKVMQILELQTKQNQLLKIAHECCRWVVCEDRAIDRELLRADGTRRIIGFTTGEGCFGEYNVTVSARADLLKDIEDMLKQRLLAKFNNWSMTRAEAAAKYCINLTENFDGSRILKALNPYDYEIHNFLAYALTVQILGMDQPDSGQYVLRSLLNLDNYPHWFDSNEIRPDFMLIEIPMAQELDNPDKPLKLSVKLIECKMSTHVDNYYDEAAGQVSNALGQFTERWNADNNRISRRYWFTQLYRAVVFSQLTVADNHPLYPLINSKIYKILNGAFEITWSSDVYAFDLGGDEGFLETEKPILNGTYSVNIHTYGQVEIQRMLMGQDDGDEIVFTPMDIAAGNETEEGAEPSEEITPVVQFTQTQESAVQNENSGSETSQNDSVTDSLTDKQEEHEIVPEPDDTIPVVQQKKNIADVRILLGNDKKSGEKIYWEFGNKNLNNRHLLINGSSGCGKTYCIQGLLMSAARQGVSSVVFDYTGGFTNSQLDAKFKEVMGDKVVQRIIRQQKIPVNPFVKHGIQIDEDIWIPEEDVDIASKISEIFTTVYSLGEQQKSAVYQAVLNGLCTYGDKMSFQLMAKELENLGTSYAKTVISKIQPFTDINPFVPDDSFDWGDIRESNGLVYVIQLVGYERETQVLLTEILLWDIWGFCVKTGNEQKPFILVMDEAQNLDHGEKSPSAKILTEGRKFGISGWYATQFMKPQLSDDEIQRLQQSGQKLYFCPPDDGVDTVAKNLETPSMSKKEWATRLKKLKKGECVTSGSMVKNESWTTYPPKIIAVPSMQERLDNE